MATQSQEQKNSQSQGVIGSDEFTIRTMHDDLSNPGSAISNHAEKDIELVVHESPKASSGAAPAPKAISPFSQELQEIPETPKPTPQIQKTFTQNNIPAATSQISAKESHPPIPAAKPVSQTPHKKSNGLFNIILIAVIILIIIVLGAGAYYFFFAKSTTPQAQPQQNTQPQDTTPQTQNESPVTINPPTEKYSSTKPNYLPLDIAVTSSTDISKALTDVSPDIETSSATVPIEFSVVDKNNNPVVFHIFAAALKINLSQNILASLGDNFSLYYFKDASSIIRLGLSVDVKDPAALKTALIKEEPTLPTELSPLFLGATPTIKTGLFKDSSYNNFAIRYFNLDTQSGLSVDYTVTDKQFVIGTSKDTLRSILDKQLLSAATSAPITSATPSQNNFTSPNTDATNNTPITPVPAQNQN